MHKRPATGAAALVLASALGFTVAGTATTLGNLPLTFEVNRGQVEERVLFLARSADYQVLLTADGATISLDDAGGSNSPERSARDSRTNIRLSFAGASERSRLAGEEPLATRSHYFLGGVGSRAIANVPHYGRVRQENVYPGVDVVYYGHRGAMEFDLVLAPGVDPSCIRLRFDGAEALEIDDSGDLVLRTTRGTLRQQLPVVYQQVGATRQPVDGRYVLLRENEVGVRVAAHDPDGPLVIDPVLSYSTFLGGRRASDTGTAIAVDAQGNTYIAGTAQSTDFPLASAYDTRIGNAEQDVFVAKLNAAGTALIYATYLGGSKGIDYATGIAIDAQGNAYVTGSTSGTDFPTTANAYQKAPASGGGAFVAKLGPSGNTLVYSTYLAGVSNTRIAVDQAGNMYVAGQAKAEFATTAGAFQRVAPSPSGGPFALVLNANGNALRYATFVGGSGTDTAKAMAVDAAGSVYLAGSTSSADFPLRNALQATRKGGIDGFVSKLDPSGSALVYSTYLGGALDDTINAIGLDRDTNVYVVGETFSGDFPTKNAAQPIKAGQHLVNSSQGSAFAAKLSAAGNAIVYSTFLGGEICYPYYCSSVFGVAQIPGDAAYGVAVDADGHAWVTGIAKSYTFPRVYSRLGQKQTDDQASPFVAKLALGGNAWLYSSLLYTGYFNGGTGVTGAPNGAGHAIAVDDLGAAYLTMDGASDFPTTPGALQTASAGGDGVVFKLATTPYRMRLEVSPNPVLAGQSLTLTATLTGAGPSSVVTFYDGRYALGASVTSNGAATLTTTLSAGLHYVSATFSDGIADADTKPIVIVVNPDADCD